MLTTGTRYGKTKAVEDLTKSGLKTAATGKPVKFPWDDLDESMLENLKQHRLHIDDETKASARQFLREYQGMPYKSQIFPNMSV